MMYPRNVASTLLLVVYVTITICGHEHGLYGGEAMHQKVENQRSKRSLSSDAVKGTKAKFLNHENMSGVLAWRKLLLNTKPLKKSKHGIMRYYKTGDFENALKDFLSVVPMDNKFKQLGDVYKGRMYIGKVGDRQVVLREKGVYSDLAPTIEITDGHRKDKIIYMGKGWGKFQ